MVGRVDRSDLGIKTPFLHNISSGPKGCEPRIYCSGFPLARSRHIWCRCWVHVVRIEAGDVGVGCWLAMACSRNQRSSLRAEGRSRHGRRRRGRSGWSARARLMREVGKRGIHCSCGIAETTLLWFLASAKGLGIGTIGPRLPRHLNRSCTQHRHQPLQLHDQVVNNLNGKFGSGYTIYGST